MFRKETLTGNYLNFQSHYGVNRKDDIIRTLCHCAYFICSPEFLEKEIDDIKNLLYRNGYLPELVSRTVKSHLNGLKREKEIGPEK